MQGLSWHITRYRVGRQNRKTRRWPRYGITVTVYVRNYYVRKISHLSQIRGFCSFYITLPIISQIYRLADVFNSSDTSDNTQLRLLYLVRPKHHRLLSIGQKKSGSTLDGTGACVLYWILQVSASTQENDAGTKFSYSLDKVTEHLANIWCIPLTELGWHAMRCLISCALIPWYRNLVTLIRFLASAALGNKI